MRHLPASVALCALLATTIRAQETTPQPPPPAHRAAPSPERTPGVTAADQKALYAIGVSVARSLSNLDLSAEEAAEVVKGISDGLAGKAASVDLDLARLNYKNLVQGRAKNILEKEKARGKAVRDQAAAAQGATVWPSGLIYTEVQAGSGESPGASDTVRVRYRGTLADGTEFDSSARGHDPATFSVNRVIRCWTEGLQKMKVGGKARLTCPAEIAYGDRGAPPDVPPGATLQFDVELVEVIQAKPTGAPTPAATPEH